MTIQVTIKPISYFCSLLCIYIYIYIYIYLKVYVYITPSKKKKKTRRLPGTKICKGCLGFNLNINKRK